MRYARQVLVDFGFAREQMARAALRPARRAAPGHACPARCRSCWRRRWSHYKRRHPRVACRVRGGDQRRHAGAAGARRGRLVLGRLTEGHSDEELDIEPLLEEPQVAVVRQGHPLLARTARLTLRRPGALALGAAAAGLAAAQPLRGGAARSRACTARLDITETASTDRHDGVAGGQRHGGDDAGVAGGALRAAGRAAGGAGSSCRCACRPST